MDFAVVWSDAAIADLHNICVYIAEHDADAAGRIGRELLEHVRVLESFPFIGPTYPRGSRGSLREIVFKPDRIFYDVSENLRRMTSSRFGTVPVKSLRFDSHLIGAASC